MPATYPLACHLVQRLPAGVSEVRRSLGKLAVPPGAGTPAAAGHTLMRTLSTPRSSVDTNQVNSRHAAAAPCGKTMSLQTFLYKHHMWSSAGAQHLSEEMRHSQSPPPSTNQKPTKQDQYLGEAVPRYALRAGPRDTVYFQPASTRIAIVTCGGICPGLNDVIRSLVLKVRGRGVGWCKV